jgi:hypothetical protein
MTKIRVTPSRLKTSADELQKIGAEVEDLGRQVKSAADRAPSYEGQFGPKVQALGVEAMARSQILAQNLSALAEELKVKGEEFETADLAGVLGLDAILAKFEAWLSSDHLLVLDEFPRGFLARLFNLGTLLIFRDGDSPDEEPDWELPWWAPVAISAANIWVGYDQNVNQYLYAMFGQGSGGDNEDSQLPVPIPPPSDEGSGPHDLEKPSTADRAFEAIIYIVAEAWQAERPDATRHMRHYLGNSGEILEMDVEYMIRDIPHFEQHSRDFLDSFLHDQIVEEIVQTYDGVSQNFKMVSDWKIFQVRKSTSKNWFFAVGTFSYAYSANVTVVPPVSTGGNPIIEMNYQMFVHDVYNWDQSKLVTIEKPIEDYEIPIPEEYQDHIFDEGDHLRIHDTALMQLHRAGLAKEYYITGQSEVQNLRFEFDLENHQISSIDTAPSISEPER